MDPSKLVLSVKETSMTGEKLAEILRERYSLEMEMSGNDYTLAMTSPFDREEGFFRLCRALAQIDAELDTKKAEIVIPDKLAWPKQGKMTISEAWNRKTQRMLLKEAEGRISGEFVYIYPPGIPVAAPGERISGEMLHTIMEYKKNHLPVQGLKDPAAEYIEIVIGE